MLQIALYGGTRNRNCPATQHQPTPEVAEKGRLPAPTEVILPMLPFDRAIRIAKYPVTLAARLESSLPEVGRQRLSRGRRSRGSRGHSSRGCGVCKECKSSRGSFARSQCRGRMGGSGLLQSFQHKGLM